VYTIVQGDLLPSMPIQLLINGAAQDLTSAVSYVLVWQKPDGTTSTVSLAPVTLNQGQVQRVWVSGDTAQIGVHLAQVQITWPGGSLQTWPNDQTYVRWYVNPPVAVV
jgi:hypothetical protein